MKKTLIQGAMIALDVAFLVFIGWQGAVLLNHLLERSNPVRIVTGFEGSPATKVTKISNTHWMIDVEEKSWKAPHFFLFRVEGAAGRKVTFEICNAVHWVTLNPVYTYASSLDDPETFSSEPVGQVLYHKAPNGPDLPDTSGQNWQFIERAGGWQAQSESRWQLLKEGKWRSLWELLMGGYQSLVSGSYVFTQQFDKDAYVCMRYPYTPGYNQRYLDSLANNPAVRVITVGTSKEGRPLQVVKIGEGGESEEKRKPCVLIYARESADEPDGSWAAQGAIDYLISHAYGASDLRKQFTFLVIPMLDPDGAAIGVSQHITRSFTAGEETPESIAYSAFFERWVDNGKPLQLVFNLHNAESIGNPHCKVFVVEEEKQRQEYIMAFYDQFLQPLIKAEGFLTAQWRENLSHDRLGAWLSDSFGTLHVPFELNAQEENRHLTIAGLHQIGKLMVLASSRYLSSQEAGPFMASVDAIRRDRATRWEKYGPGLMSYGPLEAEIKCKLRAELDAEKAKREASRAPPQR